MVVEEWRVEGGIIGTGTKKKKEERGARRYNGRCS